MIFFVAVASLRFGLDSIAQQPSKSNFLLRLATINVKNITLCAINLHWVGSLRKVLKRFFIPHFSDTRFLALLNCLGC